MHALPEQIWIRWKKLEQQTQSLQLRCRHSYRKFRTAVILREPSFLAAEHGVLISRTAMQMSRSFSIPPPGEFVSTKLEMDDLAYEVLLETGIRIQPLPVWLSEWNHPDTYSNPHLLKNIAREGIRL